MRSLHETGQSMKQTAFSLLAQGARGYTRFGATSAGRRFAARVAMAAMRRAPESRVITTRDGLHYAGMTDDMVPAYMYLFGTWEPNITGYVKRALRTGDTFIDVGANIGYFSMLASKLVGPGGSVVALEASPEFYEIVQENIRLNNCGNVRPVNVAASAAS